MSAPHWLIVARDIEAHHGTTHLEVTHRTGIPSPHRRVAEAKAHGWTFKTWRFGRLYLHSASRSGLAESRDDAVLALHPKDPPTGGQPNPPARIAPALDEPEPTPEEEARARQIAATLGFRFPVDDATGTV